VNYEVLDNFRGVIDKNKSASNYKMKPLQLDSIKFRKLTGSNVYLSTTIEIVVNAGFNDILWTKSWDLVKKNTLNTYLH
jgi:hypothetical protein